MSRKKIHVEDTFNLDDIVNTQEDYANIYVKEPVTIKKGKKGINGIKGMSIKYIGSIEGKLGVATKRLKRVVPNLQHVRIRTSEEEEEMLISKNRNFMGSSRSLMKKISLPLMKGLNIPSSKYSLSNFNFLDFNQLRENEFKENVDNRKATPMTSNMNLNATGKNFSPGNLHNLNNVYNVYSFYSGNTSKQNSDNHANFQSRIDLTEEQKIFYNTTKRYNLHLSNKVNTINLHEDLLQDINFEVKNLNFEKTSTPEKPEKERKYATSSHFYKSAKKSEKNLSTNSITGRNHHNYNNNSTINSPFENNLLMFKTYYKGDPTHTHTNSNGDWGLGIGDWGLGIGPNPQSPIPNPH
jgi:hypothetical protein